MSVDSYKAAVALLIIKAGGSDANSYGLCRLLARAFGIIDCKDIISCLYSMKFITSVHDAVVDFTVTEAGTQFLNKNKRESIKILEKMESSNPEYRNFILSIFS